MWNFFSTSVVYNKDNSSSGEGKPNICSQYSIALTGPRTRLRLFIRNVCSSNEIFKFDNLKTCSVRLDLPISEYRHIDKQLKLYRQCTFKNMLFSYK